MTPRDWGDLKGKGGESSKRWWRKMVLRYLYRRVATLEEHGYENSATITTTTEMSSESQRVLGTRVGSRDRRCD